MPDEIFHAMLLTHPPIGLARISERQGNPHPLCKEVVRYQYIENAAGATFGDLLLKTSSGSGSGDSRSRDFILRGGEAWQLFPWSLNSVTGHDMLELLRLSNADLMIKIIAKDIMDTPMQFI